MKPDAFSKLGIYDPGEWCQVPVSFAISLGGRDAFFLSYLINLYRLKVRDREDRAGWIRLSTKSIQKRLPFVQKNIERRLRSLKKLGIVETKLKGSPATRWLRIDSDRLEEVLQNAVPDGCFPIQPDGCFSIRPDGCFSIRPIIRRTSKKNSPPAAGSEMVKIKRIYVSPFRKFADDLHSMVSSVRKIASNSHPGSWAQSFRTLHKRGVPIKRIREALHWYRGVLKEHGDLIRARTFIPIAYSGSKWLEKWDSIESAMAREQPEATSPRGAPKVRMTRKKRDSSRNENFYGDTW